MDGRTKFTEALLLRAVDYAEADRIVTLFTSRLGKVSVIARGARGSRKRFQGALEPFSLLQAEIRPGRGELGFLAQAQMSRAFPAILQDLKTMRAAGAAIDLVRAATPLRQPDAGLFVATVTMLELLDRAPERAEEALLCFQARVMQLTGFEPCFDECGHCRKRPRDTQPGYFDPMAGHLICRSCGRAPIYLSAATRRRLMLALSPDWTRAAEKWTKQQLQEAGEALSLFIAHRLEKTAVSFQRSTGKGKS